MENDRILLDNDDLLVTYSANKNSASLIIAFAGRTHYRGEFKNKSKGWGEDFFNKYNLSFVSIACKNDNWYQSLLDEQNFQKIQKAIFEKLPKTTKTITYGTSMGAYAAIKFASRLNATHVLSLSPPSKIKDHPIWCEDLKDEIEPISQTDTAGVESVYIAYDPMLKDSKFDRTLDAIYVKEICKAIENEGSIHLLPFKHFAHPTSTVLAEVGLLKSMLFEIIDHGKISNKKPKKEKLYQSRKYLKFRLRNLINNNQYISASRLIYASRMFWINSEKKQTKIINILNKTGMHPNLAFLLEIESLYEQKTH